MDLHASEELYLAFKNFQDKHTYVREPKESLIRAKQIHRDFMKEIERMFQYNGICHHLEHAEDVNKIRDDPVFEPDVLLVIDKHEAHLQAFGVDSMFGQLGSAWLRLKRGQQPSPELEKVLGYWNVFGYIFGGDLYVDPNKTIDFFFNELQKVVNGSDRMKWNVMLKRRGMAIRMDVYPDSGVLFWGPRLYSVDLIPVYKVGGAVYVSKPLWRGVTCAMVWKRSYSIHENQNLSEGVLCVLRALMVVRNREPELWPLTSYDLKTVLCYELEEEDDWSDHSLVLRFLCILRRLEISLSFGNLPNFFLRKTNLLSAVPLPSLRNMRDRIRHIRSNENELMEILKP